MLEIKQDCIPGTVIRYGNGKRTMIDRFIKIVKANGFNEISIPILQFQKTINKIEEDNVLVYNLQNTEDGSFCLPVEYKTIISNLSNEYFKTKKDIRLFYVQQCFCKQKSEFGFWKEYTQFGVEIINPKIINEDTHTTTIDYIRYMAEALIKQITPNMVIMRTPSSSFDDKRTFKILCPELGKAQEVCFGEERDKSSGFYINIDRLSIIREKETLKLEQLQT